MSNTLISLRLDRTNTSHVPDTGQNSDGPAVRHGLAHGHANSPQDILVHGDIVEKECRCVRFKDGKYNMKDGLVNLILNEEEIRRQAGRGRAMK